jgi:peptidoglycan/xylan/chitin deacetylase (PgdA/CDA1 family)
MVAVVLFTATACAGNGRTNAIESSGHVEQERTDAYADNPSSPQRTGTEDTPLPVYDATRSSEEAIGAPDGEDTNDAYESESSEVATDDDVIIYDYVDRPTISGIRMDLDPDKPMIALTFDDGPTVHTEELVTLLEKHEGRATFCMVGNRIEKQADRVRMAADQGSQIIGHSWDHKQLTDLSKKKISSELKKTNDAIEKITGVRPVLYRPPYGAINDKVKEISKEENLSMLTWSLDSKDWASRDAKKIYKRIKNKTKDGQIVLLHDLHSETVDAMKKAIPWLIEEGYQLVTVEELFYYRDVEVKPGETYNHG